MEDKNEHDFKQVINEKSSHVQETFIPTGEVNNPLPSSIKSVQLFQSKPIQLIQPKLIYIFPKTLIVYAQHESLKHVTLLFE